MNRIPRRLLAALLTVVFASRHTPALQISVPRVTLTSSLGSATGAPGLVTGSFGVPSALSLPPILSLTPTHGVLPVPAVMSPLGEISAALHHDRRDRSGSGTRGENRFDGSLFDGSRGRAAVSVAAPEQAGPQGFIKSDGVWVGGRVAEQSQWIGRMYEDLSRHVDLSGVMNVMDDAYDEVRVKLAGVEKAAIERDIADTSVHLDGTRNWLDAVLVDAQGQNIAVHTHRVYFHPAPGNPTSEIGEGIRRASKYLEQAKYDFAAGGLAEQDTGMAFSQVVLSFDTRGYQEIENHLRGKEKELRAAYGDRFHFNYITEPALAPAPLRAEYNRLVEKYKNQREGLMNIIDGVTFSRKVGLGHELNSHKKRLEMGLKITQAGRDFFGKKVLPDGRVVEEYKTEFDAVTEPVADARKPAKDRDVVLWEDKSTRVWMPLDKTMEETFLYKLRIYRENRALIEASLGAPLKVAFSVDVGGLNRRAAKQGVLVWKDLRQKELLEHLQASGPALSAEYGFPVSFIFVNSHPGEASDLFYKTPIDEAEWRASLPRSGRKHSRRR